MKEFSIPFSLYDFFALLLPGAVGVFGLYLFVNPALTVEGHKALAGLVFAGLTNQVALVTGLAVLSYLMGHILNAFSELLIDRPANGILGWSVSQYFVKLRLSQDLGLKWIGFHLRHLSPLSRSYRWAKPREVSASGKLLKACVEQQFGSVFDDVAHTFSLVKAYVSKNMPEVSGSAGIFIATAAMFQSLVLAALLIGTALVRGYIVRQIPLIAFSVSLVLTLVLATMFFFSYRRYKRLWAETLYAGFVASVKGQ